MIQRTWLEMFGLWRCHDNVSIFSSIVIFVDSVSLVNYRCKRWEKSQAGVTSWHHRIADNSRISEMPLILLKGKSFTGKVRKKKTTLIRFSVANHNFSESCSFHDFARHCCHGWQEGHFWSALEAWRHWSFVPTERFFSSSFSFWCLGLRLDNAVRTAKIDNRRIYSPRYHSLDCSGVNTLAFALVGAPCPNSSSTDDTAERLGRFSRLSEEASTRGLTSTNLPRQSLGIKLQLNLSQIRCTSKTASPSGTRPVWSNSKNFFIAVEEKSPRRSL